MKDIQNTINNIMAMLASSQNPFSYTAIKKSIGISKDDLEKCIQECNVQNNHPFTIQELPDQMYTLKAKLQFDEFLMNNENKQVSESLSRAAEEVLSLLLYKGISTKDELDWLRGVNSIISVRNLIEKGLVTEDIKQDVSYYYASECVYDVLGISAKEELENFESVSVNIKNVLALKL